MKKQFIKLIIITSLISISFVPIYAQSDTSWLKFTAIDEAYIEGFGILEYGLFSVPMNRSSDFDLFVRILLIPSLEGAGLDALGGRYLIDGDSAVWFDDNPNLSINVKRIMNRYNCNASVNRRRNSDGSIQFTFNFHTDDNRWEYFAFKAYRR